MTTNRNFKRLVRDRMARTGERYATARSHVLAARPADAGPAITSEGGATSASGPFPAVRLVGGDQPDLAAALNLCRTAGVVGPDGAGLSEAMAFGLAGGIGFLYGVFEYDTGPTMTIVARHASMPDPFVEPLFARVGVTVDVATTGGSKKAASTLDAALASQQTVLCTVGAGALGYTGEAETMAAMAPHIVGVVGAETGADGEQTVLLDDRAPVPIGVERARFDAARAAYKAAKHRLVTVTGVDHDHDWMASVNDAIATAAARFDTPPVPQFAANVGFAGLTKFGRLIGDGDGSDAKRWTKVFPEGRLAAIGLSRLHDCIDHAYTAPSAGRALFADFLDEAAALGAPGRLGDAAERFRSSAAEWRAVVDLAVGAHPDLGRYAELATERAEALDGGAPDPGAMAASAAAQQELIDGCELGAADAATVYAEIGARVDAIVDAERAGFAALGGSS
ncbi:MAG: BtrH N-terminal domain-containing protein [Actinomycetota bacterium]